jgi:hypothetical protein
MSRQLPRRLLTLPFGLLVLGAVACSDATNLGQPDISDLSCSINASQIQSGGPGKDGIPALTNPDFVQPHDEGAAYLRNDDRVVGIVLDGQAYAIPLNIFWWHEIVNLAGVDGPLAITHCPLTGSSMAFDRNAVVGVEFGVSGLLYQNNLIMYDRADPESLWPQMLRGARCGAKDGVRLPMVPILETSWAGWLTLHPGSSVVSSNTGWSRNYQQYPYGAYDDPDNPQVLFQQNVDTQRPPKERVLGIPLGSGGLAFPFGILDEMGPLVAAQTQELGSPMVVFWDRARQAAMAYDARLDGGTLTFSVVESSIVDDQTQSVWQVDGLALTGPLAGSRLDPVADAFVAFWFAWPAFYPEIEIWTP